MLLPAPLLLLLLLSLLLTFYSRISWLSLLAILRHLLCRLLTLRHLPCFYLYELCYWSAPQHPLSRGKAGEQLLIVHEYRLILRYFWLGLAHRFGGVQVSTRIRRWPSFSWLASF
jgi:hypothetical protein